MQAKYPTLSLLILAITLAACGQVLTQATLPPAHTPTISLHPIAFATSTLLPTKSPIPIATDPPPTPIPTLTPAIYIVKPGDTLLGIASRFNVTTEAIQLTNPNLRPELLRIGQQITIPTGGEERSNNALLPTPTPLALTIAGFGLYETPVGGLWGLGEVVNQTENPAENVRVAISLYNTKGEPSVTLDSWVARDLIPPGESAPFGVLFPNPPADLGGHQVVLVTGERATRAGSRYPNLSIAGHQGGPAGAVFRVTGTVLNTGEQTAQDLTVLVTLYDARGQVTGFRLTTLSDPLSPGATAPFDIQLSPGGLGTDHYTVSASGRSASSLE